MTGPFTKNVMLRLTFIGLLLYTTPLFANPETDSLLRELDRYLLQRDQRVSEKIERIAFLKAQIPQASSDNRFYLYFKIYDEYKTFIYDSAFIYARKLQQEAYRSNDVSKIALAKVKLGFILLSSGMFNEALDSLSTVTLKEPIHDSIRIDFYYTIARTYHDLVDFNRDQYFTQKYTALGNLYVDSALSLCDKNLSQYYSLRAMKYLRMENLEGARTDLEHVLTNFKLSDPRIGVAASTLGYIYLREGREEDAIRQLIHAAIADNRAAIKETLAILNLAELLYKRGEVTRAYEYVKVAMDDANFYGARHRKIQVAAIFPIIEGNKLDTVEKQRKLLFVYAILITILTALLVVFGVITYRQFKKLQAADKSIKLANENLQQANGLLQEVNKHLMEANKIKEEYIGYYFNINSEYLVKIENFKQSIDNKLMAKKFDDIRFVVNNINLKKEREELYFSFDKVFLKLFPDFVTTFNSFFKEEDRFVLKEGQLLNTELRIFALIRMGIHDTEKIAKILDYSINTIYNYKARIKGKSLIPNEDFEKKIMEIRAI
jgi:tetratricopeptide (TPR) repeat protein